MNILRCFYLLENDCDQKAYLFRKKENSRFNPIHFPLVYPELLLQGENIMTTLFDIAQNWLNQDPDAETHAELTALLTAAKNGG